MRVLIQRVSNASVEVEHKIVGLIGPGLLVFVGVTLTDTEKEVDWLVSKMINLRIFPDENDKMNQSLIDAAGSVLVISQFTLYGDVKEGRRPSFINAAPPEQAQLLYESFKDKLKKEGIQVESGIFGAKMKVALINDGPVTLMIER